MGIDHELPGRTALPVAPDFNTGKKVLFATSEVHPLVKTGGLADVSAGLCQALSDLGHDVRLVLPYYAVLKEKNLPLEEVFSGEVFGFTAKVRLLKTLLPGPVKIEVLLVDAPGLLDREGGIYTDAYNRAWGDSAYMFATFCRVIAMIASDQVQLDWQPDILHCNDWQTGLAIPLLKLEDRRPGTVFTIHNLAYQGNFPKADFDDLHLPQAWWGIDGIEFYGNCSFLKAGIQFADRVTTVSPEYAREIQTEALGEGMDGLLRHRSKVFTGILNGADYDEWNPKTDRHIEQHYSALDIVSKDQNKKALQRQLDLPLNHQAPLFGLVCRMAYQKGIDLLIDALPKILQKDVQIVLLGSGDIYYEAALQKIAQAFPDKLRVEIGYDEALAHRIEAGADFFLMPSRYEPCGLNQIYSLRYGTLPIVHRTGGLADTVFDFEEADDEQKPGTGIVFDQPSADHLLIAMQRAIRLYADKTTLNDIQLNGMAQDFSWKHSCEAYLALYEDVICMHE